MCLSECRCWGLLSYISYIFRPYLQYLSAQQEWFLKPFTTYINNYIHYQSELEIGPLHVRKILFLEMHVSVANISTCPWHPNPTLDHLALHNHRNAHLLTCIPNWVVRCSDNLLKYLYVKVEPYTMFSKLTTRLAQINGKLCIYLWSQNLILKSNIRF